MLTVQSTLGLLKSLDSCVDVELGIARYETTKQIGHLSRSFRDVIGGIVTNLAQTL